MKLHQIHEAPDRSILSFFGQQDSMMESFETIMHGLLSLEGGPIEVTNDYNVSGNILTSLKFSPKKVGAFHCTDNKITSLQDVDMTVDDIFNCGNNKIESFGNMNLSCSRFYCRNNKITSFKDIHKRLKMVDSGIIVADNNEFLKHGIVNVLLIEGLNSFEHDDKTDIDEIISKYIGQPNKKLAMLQCQQELIEAGYEYAAEL